MRSSFHFVHIARIIPGQRLVHGADRVCIRVVELAIALVLLCNHCALNSITTTRRRSTTRPRKRRLQAHRATRIFGAEIVAGLFLCCGRGCGRTTASRRRSRGCGRSALRADTTGRTGGGRRRAVRIFRGMRVDRIRRRTVLGKGDAHLNTIYSALLPLASRRALVTVVPIRARFRRAGLTRIPDLSSPRFDTVFRNPERAIYNGSTPNSRTTSRTVRRARHT